MKYILRLKMKIVIMSIDEKMWQNSITDQDQKNSQQPRNRRDYEKPTASIMLHNGRLKTYTIDWKQNKGTRFS